MPRDPSIRGSQAADVEARDEQVSSSARNSGTVDLLYTMAARS